MNKNHINPRFSVKQEGSVKEKNAFYASFTGVTSYADKPKRQPASLNSNPINTLSLSSSLSLILTLTLTLTLTLLLLLSL